MEFTPDTSSAKRARARSKVASKDPVETQSVAAKKPRAPRKSPTAKKTETPVVAASLDAQPEEVGAMIATAAYYLAAARNFMPGHELDDWLEAERAIHSQLYG